MAEARVSTRSEVQEPQATRPRDYALNAACGQYDLTRSGALTSRDLRLITRWRVRANLRG